MEPLIRDGSGLTSTLRIREMGLQLVRHVSANITIWITDAILLLRNDLKRALDLYRMKVFALMSMEPNKR